MYQKGWEDTLSSIADISSQFSQSAGNVIHAVQGGSSYTPSYYPAGYSPYTSQTSLSSMLPWLLVGGIAIVLFMGMRK